MAQLAVLGILIAWRVPLLAWLELITWISTVSVRRRRTHGIPCDGTEYGSVNLTAPYLIVVNIAIKRICRVPLDDSNRGVIRGNGTCVYVIGLLARDLRTLNGTDLDRDCSDYIVREQGSGK